MKQRYNQELVLQLSGNSIQDYDAIVELENCIIAGLENLGDVDGHDMGAGEMNIFIRTDAPKLAFERIKTLAGIKDFMPNIKVAFRDIGGDDFTILYPAGLTHFVIT